MSEIAEPDSTEPDEGAAPIEHAHDPHVSLSLERLVYFSDAVFAIAITLLVLEIPVPQLPRHSGSAAYEQALIDLAPKFFAFVLSFLVVGRFWMSHHEFFSKIHAFHRRLMWPNVLLLMVIAFMPFSTALLGDNLGAFVPAVFYDLTLLAAGLLSWWLLRIVRKLGLMPENRAGPPSVVFAALVSFGIAFWSPSLSQVGMLTLPLWAALHKRRWGKKVGRAPGGPLP